jgi:signal transduction histidine kinase
MSQVMRAEICLLFLIDESGQRIVLRQSFGLGESRALDNAFYELGQGITGGVAATGIAQRIGRTSGNTGRYDTEIAEILSQKANEPTRIESLMAAPIKAPGRDGIFGTMKVINKAGEHTEYTDEDLVLFQIFADYVGVAIANAEANEALDREEKAVEDRNRSLSLLVRAVAHEINNSFGIIPANLGVVRKKMKKPDSGITSLLDVIDEAARQASDFANTIAGFSATHRGEKLARDLNELVRRARNTIDPLRYDPKSEIRVEDALSPDPLICNVYSGSFQQSVRNIVINAFQALEGRKDGRIVVSSERGSGERTGFALIRISDNGPGIRPEYLERVFEPEFTTKKGVHGNGVGLWLVRDQLKLVDGRVNVESVLGSGATFTIAIPLESPQEDAP